MYVCDNFLETLGSCISITPIGTNLFSQSQYLYHNLPFPQHILRSLESLEEQDREHLPGMLASSLANQRIYTRL